MREEPTRQARGSQTQETAWIKVLRPQTYEWTEKRQWVWHTEKKRESGLSWAQKGRQVLDQGKYLGHVPKSNGRPMKTLERQWPVQNYLFNSSLSLWNEIEGSKEEMLKSPVKKLLFLPKGERSSMDSDGSREVALPRKWKWQISVAELITLTNVSVNFSRRQTLTHKGRNFSRRQTLTHKAFFNS